MSTLGDYARARAGDKGDTSIIVVLAREGIDPAVLEVWLTVEAIADHFGVSPSAVDVRPVRELGTCTVVIRGRLDGGVTRSRTGDPHGKTLSGHILDLVVDASHIQEDA
ncbi:MAG: hypothetical protein QM607_12150 [Microbacterium sp.]